MSLLFSPTQIGAITLKNRIVVSPMCQYSAVDGVANHWHLVHLGQYAIGGAGLIMQEATAVTPEGRISPDDLGLWDDHQAASLQPIVDFVHQQGAAIGIQLAHAGRKASTASPWKGHGYLRIDEGGWEAVAPSSIPFNNMDDKPKEMSINDIRSVIESFAAAAKRAVGIGYNVIEIHAAHGYLIHQFLSPIANKRTDIYGGSFENRIRFLLEIVNAVKAQLTGSQSLFVRISATDYVEGGWDIEQSVELCKALKNAGVDLIDVSSGGMVPAAQIQIFKNYQVPFATEIRKKVGIPVGAVGIIVKPQQAEEILQTDAADLIFIGREFLRNPYFPLQAAKILDGTNIFPNQYKRAFR